MDTASKLMQQYLTRNVTRLIEENIDFYDLGGKCRRQIEIISAYLFNELFRNDEKLSCL